MSRFRIETGTVRLSFSSSFFISEGITESCLTVSCGEETEPFLLTDLRVIDYGCTKLYLRDTE